MRPLALAAIAAILCFLSLSARGQLLSRTPPQDTVTYRMKEGAFLAFRQVNLSMGEIGFEVTISSNIKTKNGPRLEFRIDRPKGKKIGTLKIPDTADTTPGTFSKASVSTVRFTFTTMASGSGLDGLLRVTRWTENPIGG